MTVHDHRCSGACAASEEHMRAMDLDADRQVTEAEADDEERCERCDHTAAEHGLRRCLALLPTSEPCPCPKGFKP